MDDGERRRIRGEIDRLAETIGYSGLPGDDDRVVAWAAERDRLYARLAGKATATNDERTGAAMKIKVGKCRKEGRANYGSDGAMMEIEFEVDDALAAQPAELRKAAKRWFEECERLVADELDEARVAARHAAEAVDPNGAAERQTYERAERPAPQRQNRPMTQREADAPDDRYDNRDEPIRDDRRRYDDNRGGGGNNRGGGYGRGGAGGGGRRNDGPPTSAKQLGGWARRNDCIRWFEDFGENQGWGRFLVQWHDDDAMFAYREYVEKVRSPGQWGGGERNGASNGYQGNGRR